VLIAGEKKAGSRAIAAADGFGEGNISGRVRRAEWFSRIVLR
jgi:hypothetical protein